jgi:hypothetical protein
LSHEKCERKHKKQANSCQRISHRFLLGSVVATLGQNYTIDVCEMKKGLIGKVWTADSVLRRDRNKDYEVGLLNNPRHERFGPTCSNG